MNGQSESLSIVEDGLLELGESIENIVFHQNLNVFIVVTKDNSVRVFDPHTSAQLADVTLSNTDNGKNNKVKCMYFRDSGYILLCDGKNIGLRQDHQGVLLLNTILQTQVESPEDNVTLEILLSEALQLQQILGEVNNVENAAELKETLALAIDGPLSQNCSNPKVGKWRTVCISLPHGILKGACTSLVSELRHLAYFIPALSLASALCHRLTHLALPTSLDAVETDKESMFSEAARLATFAKWPHMNYKWALPDQMAQAGFFHQPVANDDDRAMCFICNVCLVYWEPTDEPWSEHERHYPNCPFVKGDYTHNVPLSVTRATNPAQPHSRVEEIYIVSVTNSRHFVATATRTGYIVIWNVSKELKKEMIFSVDPSDSVILDKHFSDTIGYTDIPLLQSLPKEAWADEKIVTVTIQGSSTGVSLPSVASSGVEKSLSSTGACPDAQKDLKLKIHQESRHEESESVNNVSMDFSDKGDSCLLVSSSLNGLQCLDLEEEVLQTASSSDSLSLGVKNTSVEINLQVTNGEVTNKKVPESGFAVNNRGGHYAEENQSGVELQLDSSAKSGHLSLEGLSDELFAPPRPTHDVQVSCMSIISDPGDLMTGTSGNSTIRKSNRCCLAVGVGLRHYNIFNQVATDGCVQVLNNVNYSAQTGIKSSDILKVDKEEIVVQEGNCSTSSTGSINEIGACASQIAVNNFVPYLLVYDLSPLTESPMVASNSSTKPTHQGTSKKSARKVTVPSGYALIKMKGDQPQKDIAIASKKGKGISSESAESCRKSAPKCLQCIPLPNRLNRIKLELYVNKILLSLCGQYLLVLLLPQERLISTQAEDNVVLGGLILYQISSVDDSLYVQEEPLCTRLFTDPNMIPREIVMVPTVMNDTLANHLAGCVCFDGSLRILSLMTLSYLLYLPCQEKPFNNLVYCHSLERLCVTREDGKVVLVQLKEDIASDTESSVAVKVLSALHDNRSTENIADSEVEIQSHELLVNQNISEAVLDKCIELTNFQVGCPRFVATVPPCWSEIIQAQKQRRNPQHLQHQAEDLDTTRTWKLESDSTTFDEHIFDILLPLGGGSVGTLGNIQVGHIDVKFSFNVMAQRPLPKIQVTLLKQYLKSPCKSIQKLSDGLIEESFPENPVVTRDFLLTHKAEILCGPVTVNEHIDLSGQASHVTLTSPALLACKSRSFLIHIKAIDPKSSHKRNELKQNDLELTGHYVPPQAQNNTDKISSLTSKRSELVRGCNVIKELSLTLHCCTKTSIPHERLQRLAMVEKESFHQGLLKAIVDPSSSDYLKQRALDLFLWILSVHVTAVNDQIATTAVSAVSALEDSLLSLVRSSILCGDRVLAHKTTKIIMTALESISDSSQQMAFGSAVLMALINCLDIISNCQSAGALYWFFSLLNHVKWCNQFCTAGKVTELLTQTSEVLSEKTDPLHVLLQTKFCLSGTPLERELFDTFPPLLSKQATSLSSSQLPVGHSMASNHSNGNNNDVSSSWSKYDCISLFSGGLSGKSIGVASPLTGTDNGDTCFMMGQKGYSAGITPYLGGLCGLFEVEPLHFSLHMASDGTKMERILSGSAYSGNPYLAESFHVTSSSEKENGFNTTAKAADSSVNLIPHSLLHLHKAVEDMEEMELKNQALEQLLYQKASYKSFTHKLDYDDDDELVNLIKLTSMDVDPKDDDSKVLLSISANMKSYGVEVGSGEFSNLNGVTEAVLTAAFDPSIDLMEDTDDSDLQHFVNSHVVEDYSHSIDDIPSLADVTNVKQADEKTLLKDIKLEKKNNSNVNSGSTINSSSNAHLSLSQECVKNVISTSEKDDDTVQSDKESSVDELKERNANESPMVAKLINKILDISSNVIQDSGQNGSMQQAANASVENDLPTLAEKSPPPPLQRNTEPKLMDKTSLSHSCPVQQVLSIPPQHMIVIERMHSGARRFVVLDFGAPVILTDVIIPACSDLVSLTIDIWLSGEETDGERLVVASDIGVRPLVLSDLQPAPLCRYLKITTLGRYGMITSQCRIPVGAFYGHTLILPWYLQPYQPQVNILSKHGAKTQLTLLSSMMEDVLCRYSIACSKLRMLLQPLNKLSSSRMLPFEASIPGCTMDLDVKIRHAYHECVMEQQHLNLISAVMRRLQKFLGGTEMLPDVDTSPSFCNVESRRKKLMKCSSDKLAILLQHLLNCVLTLSLPPPNSLFPKNLLGWCDSKQARALIEHVCIKGPQEIQTSVVALLARLCANQQWWGEFSASVILSLFSSGRSSQLPAARLFALLTYLGQKSVQCGRGKIVIDSIVKTLCTQLENGQFIDRTGMEEEDLDQLDMEEIQNVFNEPSSQFDTQLVSWLLLNLSLCLDSLFLAKTSESEKCKGGRWVWLSAESCLQKQGCEVTKGAPKSTRERLRKRLVHHKQQLINLESATKSLEEVFAGLGGVVNPSMAKHSEQIFKKIQKQHVMKHFKDLCSIQRNETNSLRRMNRNSYNIQSAGQKESKDDDVMGLQEEEISLPIDTASALRVIQGLMNFLMNSTFPCTIDSFLLICKVIGGLVKVSRPSLKVCEILTENQLELLFCHAMSLDSCWGSHWALFAITCLLQDALEGERLHGAVVMSEGANQSDLLETNSSGEGPISGNSHLLVNQLSERSQALEDLDCASAQFLNQSSKSLHRSQSDLSDIMQQENQMKSTSDVDFEITQLQDSSTEYIQMQNSASDFTQSSSSSTTESPQESLPSNHVDDSEMLIAVFAVNSSEGECKESKSKILTNGEVNEYPQSSTVSSVSQADQSATSISPPVVNVATSHFTAVQEDEGPGKYAFLESGDSSESDDMMEYLTDLQFDLNSVAQHLLNNTSVEDSFNTVTGSWVPITKYGKESRVGDLMTAPLSTQKQKPGTEHSTALDSRLENGVSMMAEVRIHMMNAVHSSRMNAAMTMPLHQVTSSPCVADNKVYGPGDLKQSIELLTNVVHSILSKFAIKCNGNQIENVLELWVNLNVELAGGEYSTSVVPFIPLHPSGINSLLAAVTRAPNVSIRCWCLVMQTLTLCCNLTPSEEQINSGIFICSDSTLNQTQFEPLELCWMAVTVISDKNFVPMLLRLLNGSYSSSSHNRCSVVGATLTSLFEDLLVRLEIRCDVIRQDSVSGNLLKMTMLNLVMKLLEQDSAFPRGLGPLDTQKSLLGIMLSMHYEGLCKAHIPLAIINSIASVVNGFLSSNEEHFQGSPEQNTSMLSGLFASVLGSDLKQSPLPSRKIIMCLLLNLANRLIQLPLADSSSVQSSERQQTPDLTSLTDAIKLEKQKNLHPFEMATCLSSQTDEHKALQNPSTSGTPPQSISGSSATEQNCAHSHPNKTVHVADLVLQNNETLQLLLTSLGMCSGNSITMILLGIVSGDISEKLGLGQTLTDALYQLLMSLNHKSTDVDNLLSAILRYITPDNSWCEPYLSEALFCFFTQVLDCAHVLRKFAARRGLEVMWKNLVNSVGMLGGGRVGLVASVMNHLSPPLSPATINTATNTTSTSSRRIDPSICDTGSTRGLQNFAALATITSSNPTARPADALLRSAQCFPRTKSPPWSYHFYPDENWVDLNLTLPCPILLHEVHLQPHSMSLGMCPSGVSIEAGVDGGCILPVTTLVNTAGLASIRIVLSHPVVASVVVVRLYKPCDQPTLGLSHLKLLGTTTFKDCLRSVYEQSSENNEPYKTSYWWLRLINHCMTHEEDILKLVVESGACVPRVVESCVTLLLTPSIPTPQTPQSIVDTSAMSVSNSHLLLNTLSSTLLENTTLALVKHNRQLLYSLFRCLSNHPLMLQTSSSSTMDSAMALLYMISMNTEGTKLLIQWLSKIVRDWLSSEPSLGNSCTVQKPINVGILQCVAAVLWNVTHDVSHLLSEELFRKIYKWTELATDEVKEGLDHILGSMCKIQPHLFTLLLQYMGILTAIDFRDTSLTDDRKDREADIRASQTDDMKEGVEDCSRTAEERLMLQDPNMISLSSSHLQTLSLAAQSAPAIQLLLDSGFPLLLVHGILDWCKVELLHQVESCATPSLNESFTDWEKVERAKCSLDYFENNSAIGSFVPTLSSTYMIAQILETLTVLSAELPMKEWVGSGEGSAFWIPLLTVLGDPIMGGSEMYLSKNGTESQIDYSHLEDAAIQLMRQCCQNHLKNQKVLAAALCHLIQRQNSPTPGGMTYLHSLSGFTRRLILQVLLESDKVLVQVSSSFGGLCIPPSATFPLLPKHPRYQTGHKRRLLYLPVSSKIEDVVKMVTDWWPGSSQGSTSASGDSEGPPADAEYGSYKQELGEVGLELVDKLSVAAGVTAKEKRNKDKSAKCQKKGSLLRERKKPPGTSASASMAGSAMLANFGLVHDDLLGGSSCLPSNLTLAQTMMAIKLAGGSLPLELSFSLVFLKDFAKDTQESLAATSMVNIEPLPTTLHIFTSVGGLSSLAEHMTLLYPDTTVQYFNSNSSRSLNEGKSSEKMTDDDFMGFHFDYLSNTYVPEFLPATGIGNSPCLARGGPVSFGVTPIPPHSLGAFTLFLRLPGYAETMFIDTPKACSLLRLALGVSDSLFEGDSSLSALGLLATLPFQVLELLLRTTPLTTDDGQMLRKMCLLTGSLHLILACLATLSHQESSNVTSALHHPNVPIGLIVAAARSSCSEQKDNSTANRSDGDRCHYWAKGTGFGTGSTNQSWNIEQALIRQKMEEQHVVWLIRLLAQYINPADSLPPDLQALCQEELKALKICNQNVKDDGNCLRKIIYQPSTASCGNQSTSEIYYSNGAHSEVSSDNAEELQENETRPKYGDMVGVMEPHETWTTAPFHGHKTEHEGSKMLPATGPSENTNLSNSCVEVDAHLTGNITNENQAEASRVESSASLLPSEICELFINSGLIVKIASYLSNDSVLDMSRHVPLYRALMALVRGIAVNPALVPLLKPPETAQRLQSETNDTNNEAMRDVASLLTKMKCTVNTYMAKLKWKAAKGVQLKDEDMETSEHKVIDDCEDQGLSLLVPDIHLSTKVVEITTQKLRQQNSKDMDPDTSSVSENTDTHQSYIDVYLEALRPFQFDSFEMIVEDADGGIRFVVPYRYENLVRTSGDSCSPKRMKRLAQEAVTLSTSLPLSYSSSVFVRTDMDRLDVMKVLITGPEDTPYANGCFEFDVYFPNTYPSSPLYINLQTTGERRVRFNPNLYQDGKVCLSILNTWHGRPEEKWNPQTSSLLQVLVSIQSLIFVPEPYFNEPGYERSRGSQAALHNSQEYDASIRTATVRWAILNQMKNPSPAFKEVIDHHFWLKRREIMSQVEGWITEMEVLCESRRTGRVLPHHVVAIKKLHQILNEEFGKMTPPKGLENIPVTYVHPDGSHSSVGPSHHTTLLSSGDKTQCEELGEGTMSHKIKKIWKSNFIGGQLQIQGDKKTPDGESAIQLHHTELLSQSSMLHNGAETLSSNTVMTSSENATSDLALGKYGCDIVANLEAILSSENVTGSKNMDSDGADEKTQTLTCDSVSFGDSKEVCSVNNMHNNYHTDVSDSDNDTSSTGTVLCNIISDSGAVADSCNANTSEKAVTGVSQDVCVTDKDSHDSG